MPGAAGPDVGQSPRATNRGGTFSGEAVPLTPARDCQNVSECTPPRHAVEMRERTMATVRRLIVVVLLGWASVAQADESVWDALREPAGIVVLRHSYAPGTFDPPTARLDDCSTQRNLDEAGPAHATRRADAFCANLLSLDALL